MAIKRKVGSRPQLAHVNRPIASAQVTDEAGKIELLARVAWSLFPPAENFDSIFPITGVGKMLRKLSSELHPMPRVATRDPNSRYSS